MTRTIPFLLGSALTSTLLLSTPSWAEKPTFGAQKLNPAAQAQVSPTLQNKAPQLKTPPKLALGCPDPALTLQVGWPGRNADGTYSFRVVATIKNAGRTRFHSNRQQTLVTISEGTRVMKSEVWTSRAYSTVTLEPGEGVSSVAVVNAWNPNSEFLVDYTAQISYDPDIRTDDNPENDDCNSGNNSARLTVAQVRQALQNVR